MEETLVSREVSIAHPRLNVCVNDHYAKRIQFYTDPTNIQIGWSARWFMVPLTSNFEQPVTTTKTDSARDDDEDGNDTSRPANEDWNRGYIENVRLPFASRL